MSDLKTGFARWDSSTPQSSLLYTLWQLQKMDEGGADVGNLRKHVQECGLTRRIDLVIVSPLLRTIQTAVGVFGGEDYVDGVDVPPLMVANAGNSEHPAISSLNCPPFLAVETCRERLGAHPCDKRRSITEYRPLFPAIDFSLAIFMQIESDEDILWTAEKREVREEVAARGMRFFDWLWTRKEKEIAIVTHSGFLFDTLEGFGNDCHPSVKKEISKVLANCELRSMVLVDKSGIGHDLSTTNYRPRELDLPSGVAQEKHPEKMGPNSVSFTSFSDMESNTSTTLFPSHRCKTLHLVRHAQGFHNVEGEKNPEAYLSPALFDAHLTPLGWEQVGNLRKHVHECGLTRRIDLVIVSPLLRTMQTAVGVFGGEDYVNGVDVPPLMIANAGSSEHPAISSLNCPPFLAVETCREHLIESDEDILWTTEKREADEELAARGMRFINWLWTRKEKEIVIVTHSGFLFHTLKGFGNDCHPSVKQEIGKHFANCELRSMVLVDRSLIGLDLSTTNYPGKVPCGLDLSSDVAQKKHPEKIGPNSV
ncbi:phosphoglycerate mutase-like protein 1 isoform X1 [Cinnamomum micranthum f. kanehirae]|uniref:Phosphoglycerate mutase-like protein 1 isoform X1 n=1 Tax=Cinnamomum micranthum f. kanehirae TaxID=337451 RepID=A0A3S3M6E8_9MAGN|nr:phosphoglycerate mutase-like protein 1 isoform X1 [Cinnamomum micranthum f. kanehirae]